MITRKRWIEFLITHSKTQHTQLDIDGSDIWILSLSIGVGFPSTGTPIIRYAITFEASIEYFGNAWSGSGSDQRPRRRLTTPQFIESGGITRRRQSQSVVSELTGSHVKGDGKWDISGTRNRAYTNEPQTNQSNFWITCGFAFCSSE